MFGKTPRTTAYPLVIICSSSDCARKLIQPQKKRKPAPPGILLYIVLQAWQVRTGPAPRPSQLLVRPSSSSVPAISAISHTDRTQVVNVPILRYLSDIFQSRGAYLRGAYTCTVPPRELTSAELRCAHQSCAHQTCAHQTCAHQTCAGLRHFSPVADVTLARLPLPETQDTLLHRPYPGYSERSGDRSPRVPAVATNVSNSLCPFSAHNFFF